ncbi:DEAD/DEAH box helicase family protein [Orenia marismortui]|uniref:Replicative superfamily II helicase n=1 Tax=Orenia marismortui TaxID=46469 RepID=A0A4R8GT38_9FIRM|nr:DEAD/DEAH box helicase family protein [Orenia marismortui]TDX49145.1 replicative superfamily II helicase [Orenia marismortui]
MKIDFGKLTNSSSIDSLISPRKIFSALPQKHEKYDYVRDVQAEVIEKWIKRKDNRDNIIKMNTGSGKTVVGLLILKSCLNGKKGPAVYVAPDPYLVQQVINEANNLGIEVTTDPNSLRFRRGKAILIINIYKLINGKSIFGINNEEKIKIKSIIIDDAHACMETTEAQFTLNIDASTQAYKEFFKLFRNDLYNQSKYKLLEIEAKEPNINMLVPYWVWNNKIDDIYRILYKFKDEDYMEFVLPLIKDSLHLCNCVLGSDGIEISPKYVPINTIPSFINAERRIFMSATLTDDSILISHFDVNPNSISKAITPSNCDDIGDRMILVPQELNPKISDDELKNYFNYLSKEHNTIIIVPSNYRANYWKDVADLTLRSNNLQEGIKRLKEGHVGLVILVNKYDGIDLPKKACEVLVIDGLPDVRRKIDKIKQNILMGSDEILTQLIQRVEQGMGRGTRSRDDYCAVFLMGRTLTSHLYAQNALEKFTPATKAQINLSEELSEQVREKSLKEIHSVIKYLLQRDKDWVEASKSRLIDLEYNSEGQINSNIKKGRKAFDLAQIKNYKEAVSLLEELKNKEQNKKIRGWLKQEIAEYMNFYNPVKSQQILKSALNDNKFVLHPVSGIEYDKLIGSKADQAVRCSDFLNNTYSNTNNFILELNSLIERLNFAPNTYEIFEQTLKQITNIIGFNGQRPESEFGKGPDVLWETGNLNYFVIECKNEARTDIISKKYCNQLNGSMYWFEEKYDDTCSAIPIMVHPSNLFEYSASPHQQTRIINEEKLNELKKSLLEFANTVVSSNKFADPQDIAKYLKHYNLEYEQFIKKYTIGFKVKN